MPTNPYQSPTTTCQRSAQANRWNLGSALSSFLIFVIVAFSSFFQLTLTFFGDSTGHWPGFVCGGIAIVIGIAVAYLATTAGFLQRVGTASLLAAGATSLLITVALLAYKRSLEGLMLILPTSVHDMAPGHLILITSSTLGSVFGLWGCVCGQRTGRGLATIVGGGCGMVCICHLVAVGIRLVRS